MNAAVMSKTKSSGNSVAELKKRAFHCEKENSGDDVHAEFHAEKRWRGCEIDVVIGAELFDPVNNKFLNQVGNAGDERGAGSPMEF
jgi:hypothetical protein